MENFEEQLTKLLDEGKLPEAKKLITDFLAQPLSEKEQGAIAFNKALVFIRAKNELNKEYILKTQEILKELDKVEKMQESHAKESALEDVRGKIKDL